MSFCVAIFSLSLCVYVSVYVCVCVCVCVMCFGWYIYMVVIGTVFGGCMVMLFPGLGLFVFTQ